MHLRHDPTCPETCPTLGCDDALLAFNSAGITPVEASYWSVGNVACSRYTNGILAQSALGLSRLRSPTRNAMTWRVCVSMAIQIHCLMAFRFTKLHISSASAS